MNAILLPALLLVCSADEQPKPKVPVGKETTYATGPIDKNGYIDYEAALNDRLGKGITPEKNAVVLLWKALGPAPEGGDGMPPEFFKRLGMKEPPAEGDYFIDLSRFMKDHLELDPQDYLTVYDQLGRAGQRPWTTKDYPEIAAWLQINEKPLAIVIEASKRPRYFSPLVSHRGEGDPSSLLRCPTPGAQKCRFLAAALTARAMFHLAAGKHDAAWDDLMACHRLARHLTHGATLVESLVGIAIHQLVQVPTLAYLERAPLTSKQILAKLKELQDRVPAGRMADTIDLGGRFICLDSLQAIRSGRPDGPNQKPGEEEIRALDLIDWDPAFRSCNKWYDRMVEALRMKDRDARNKAFDLLEEELERAVKASKDLGDLNKLLESGDPSKAVGQRIGDILMGLLAPALRKVQGSFDRMEQVERNLHVAFALAAYHKDNGRYPEKLADLAPRYLAVVPDDLFSSKPLIYRPGEKGYLFYSVGINGKDDEGRWYNDDPPGDDPGVRMPAPEAKKK
jgi:hypothetical protein